MAEALKKRGRQLSGRELGVFRMILVIFSKVPCRQRRPPSQRAAAKTDSLSTNTCSKSEPAKIFRDLLLNLNTIILTGEVDNHIHSEKVGSVEPNLNRLILGTAVAGSAVMIITLWIEKVNWLELKFKFEPVQSQRLNV